MNGVEVVGSLVVVIGVTVVPVMLAAKWARARRSGLFAALAAVVLAAVAAQAAVALIGPPLLALGVALIAGCLVYALVLGTSFVAAVGVAVVALVLHVLIVAGLIALGLELPAGASVGGSI